MSASGLKETLMMSLRLHPPLKTYNILIGNFKIDEILIINLTKIHYGSD